MANQIHYKPEEHIDELLGRYYSGPDEGLFKDVDTLLIGNNLLIARKDAKKMIDKLFRLGYIVDSVYLYKVSGDSIHCVSMFEPNFDCDTEYHYPSRGSILEAIDSEPVDAMNYIEIIAGTVETEYRK